MSKAIKKAIKLPASLVLSVFVYDVRANRTALEMERERQPCGTIRADNDGDEDTKKSKSDTSVRTEYEDEDAYLL